MMRCGETFLSIIGPVDQNMSTREIKSSPPKNANMFIQPGTKILAQKRCFDNFEAQVGQYVSQIHDSALFF